MIRSVERRVADGQDAGSALRENDHRRLLVVQEFEDHLAVLVDSHHLNPSISFEPQRFLNDVR